jgi:clathrin heavy chain
VQLFVLEVDGETDSKFEKKSVDFFFPREAVGDFPVVMEASEKFGTLFMLTKAGYLFVFDIISGKTIFMNRISANTIFTSCRHGPTDGLLGINTIGQV